MLDMNAKSSTAPAQNVRKTKDKKEEIGARTGFTTQGGRMRTLNSYGENELNIGLYTYEFW